VINLLDLKKPDDSYLMLERVLKEKTENKYLYLIHFNEPKTMKLVK